MHPAIFYGPNAGTQVGLQKRTRIENHSFLKWAFCANMKQYQMFEFLLEYTNKIKTLFTISIKKKDYLQR